MTRNEFGPPSPAALSERLQYWLGLPLRWAYQVVHNGHGIVRVLDICKFRPMRSGLIGPTHPWVTGLRPDTQEPIWHANVIFRSPRGKEAEDLPSDDLIVTKTGQFLAHRVSLSATETEIPQGPRRRMPHGINYIHGTSHYNSGILIFTNFEEAYGYITDPRFVAEIKRFAKTEQREVLILFRQKEYSPREFAYLSCCMRTLFPWFCNANGPKGRVLWGNAAPFPAANLITGAWIKDVYALKRPEGAAQVVRPPIAEKAYFQGEYGGGRLKANWPEKALAWATYWRIRLRGGKGGMFFVNRKQAYADQLERQRKLGILDEPIVRL